MAMVAIPDAPLVAVTVTPVEPLKSRVEILPPVPTTDPLWFLTVRPPIAPVPSAVIPVKFAFGKALNYILVKDEKSAIKCNKYYK